MSILIALLVSNLPLAAASVETEEPALNTMCPVMTDEEADPEITVTYRGRLVAFCCDRCVRKFNENPAKYLPNLPQFAGFVGGFASEEESRLPATGNDSPLTTHDALPPPMPFWGRLHPAIVHLPIAGLPLALLGFVLWSATGRETLARADVVALVPAALASVAAVITGDIAEAAERFSPSMHEIAEQHEWLSWGVMILALALLALRLVRWNRLRAGWRWVYGTGLALASGLVAATGYLGGSLVFGPDHLKW